MTAVTVGAANVATAIPTLTSPAIRPRYLVAQVLSTTAVYVKTGDETASVMTAANQGILLQRNSGDLLLKLPRGHTHVHTWADGPGTVILTPLSARPT